MSIGSFGLIFFCSKKFFFLTSLFCKEIDLPDIKTKEYALTSIKCNNFSIATFQSSATGKNFVLSLEDFQLECYADWSLILLGSGYVNFTAAARFDVDMNFVGNSYPTSIKLNNIQSGVVFENFVIHSDHSVENWILKKLRGIIKDELTKVVDGKIQSGLTSVISDLSANLGALSKTLSAKKPATLVPIFVDHGYIDVQTNPFFRLLAFALNEAVGTEGPLNINYLLDQLTDHTDTLNIPASNEAAILTFNQSIAGFVSVELMLMRGNVSNLNTWKKLSLFVPDSHTSLSSSFDVGTLSFNDFWIKSKLKLDENPNIKDNVDWTEDLDFNLELQDVSSSFSNSLLLSENVFSSMEGDQLLSLECVRSGVDNVTVDALDTSLVVKHFEVHSKTGTDENFLNVFNDVFGIFNQNFAQFFPRLGSMLVDQQIAHTLDTMLVSQFSNNQSACPLYNDKSQGLYSNFGMPFITTLVPFCVAGFFSVLIVAGMLVSRNSPKHKTYPALFNNERASLFIRILLPVVIIFVMALNVTILFATSGYTVLIVHLGQQQILPDALFLFNIPDLINQAYQSKAWANVFGLAIFAIFWVFMHNLLLLFAFFVPTNVLSIKNRRRILDFCQVFGKFIAFFQVQAMILPVAFRLHVEPVQDVAFDLITTGSLAFFLYILSVYVSIFCATLMLHYSHR